MIRRISPQELLFQEYVVGTVRKSRVYLTKSVICSLNAKVYRKLRKKHRLDNSKVFISTKVLKHIYDDHATYFKEIIPNLDLIIRLPDAVYKNKPGKGGEYLFIKKLKGQTYCVVLDILLQQKISICEIRTSFNTPRPELYLRGSECIYKTSH